VAFLVLSTPLKKDTAANIQRLVDSSHFVVMITGVGLPGYCLGGETGRYSLVENSHRPPECSWHGYN
jgi:hypothetical protein